MQELLVEFPSNLCEPVFFVILTTNTKNNKTTWNEQKASRKLKGKYGISCMRSILKNMQNTKSKQKYQTTKQQ